MENNTKLKKLEDFLLEKMNEADEMAKDKRNLKGDKIHLKGKAFAYFETLTKLKELLKEDSTM